MHYTRSLPLALAILAANLNLAADPPAAQRAQAATAAPAAAAHAGERVPSEDAVVDDFHSLGLIEGRVNVFRCACPVRDLGKAVEAGETAWPLDAAVARMKHLHDLGITTVIDLEDPAKIEGKNKVVDAATRRPIKPSFALERAAAEKAGIRFLSRPLRNSGKNSLEDLSDEAALELIAPIAAEILAAAKSGGVAFHCSAGHDRTGIVAGLIRIKYQHWPASEAIGEMRRFGHNWEKFSRNGGQCSWHEEHLRGFENMVRQPANR
jgi:hypothetical protein